MTGLLQLAAQAAALAEALYQAARAHVPAFAAPAVAQAEAALVDAVKHGRELHAANLAAFAGAKERAYAAVEHALDQAKALLDPAPYVQRAGDAVSAYADPDKLIDVGVAYAGRVAAFGPVPKAVELVQPLLAAGVGAYCSAHDAVVALPAYHKACELALASGDSLRTSWAGRALAEQLYPLLAPLADPLAANCAQSKYLAALRLHLAPAKAA